MIYSRFVNYKCNHLSIMHIYGTESVVFNAIAASHCLVKKNINAFEINNFTNVIFTETNEKYLVNPSVGHFSKCSMLFLPT